MLKPLLKLSCAIAVLATPVAAQDYYAQKGLKAIEFLHGWRTAKGTHMAAVRILLEDGWKTYWRAPGSGGIPPQFTWKGSSNIASVKYHWPSPKMYLQNGIQTIGYKNELILPIEFLPKIKGEAIDVKTQVEFGICEEVCIPVNSRLEIMLTPLQNQNQPLIKKTLANKPRSAKSSGVKSVSCQVDPTEDGLAITANISFRNNAPDVRQAVIEFAHPNIWMEQTGLKNTGKKLVAMADLVSFYDPFFLDRSKLRVTLVGDARAIEIIGCPAPS